MATYVALFRGINVGKAKRVAMADLRRLLTGLGFTEVTTLLNSGNAVFACRAGTPRSLAAKIEQAVADRLGLDSRVTVLTAAELKTIVAENPLTAVAVNPSRLLAAVPAREADLRLLGPLTKQSWQPEAFAVGSRAAYTWCPDGLLESPLGKALAKALGDRVTSRNWATLEKLMTTAGRLAGGARSSGS